jgi:hypothetical protein
MNADQKIYRLAYWISLLIVAMVLLSGYHKMLHPADFSLAVYRFHLLPDVMVNAVSLYVQWVEIVCAVILLFVPKYRVAALWIVLILLAMFTSGIIVNLAHDSSFSCGCFSSSPLAKPMDWLNVARNVGLIALVILALLSGFRSRPNP